MSFIQRKLTVAQSVAQHQLIVIRTIERLLERTVVNDLAVDTAVRAWYRGHPPRVRSLLRHEEPLYTALAIVDDPVEVARYEEGAGRKRYISIVEEALADWWSQHPELYTDESSDDERVLFDDGDETI